MKKCRGFTIVEILIVVAIIGLVMTISLPNLMMARNTARQNLCYNNLRLIGHALERWRIETDASDDTTPDNINVLGEYIKGDAIPICPADGEYSFGEDADDIDCSVHGTYNVATGEFTE